MWQNGEGAGSLHLIYTSVLLDFLGNTSETNSVVFMRLSVICVGFVTLSLCHLRHSKVNFVHNIFLSRTRKIITYLEIQTRNLVNKIQYSFTEPSQSTPCSVHDPIRLHLLSFKFTKISKNHPYTGHPALATKWWMRMLHIINFFFIEMKVLLGF